MRIDDQAKEFIEIYSDFYDQEYSHVLSSVRAMISVTPALIGFYLTHSIDYIWFGFAIFVWILHTTKQNFFLNMSINFLYAIVLTTSFQFIGFFCHKNLIIYCVFSFLIAALVAFFYYIKKDGYYGFCPYLLIQNSTLHTNNILFFSKQVAFSFVACLLVFLVCRFLVRPNLKKSLMIQLRSNLKILSDYVEIIEIFIFNKNEENYKKVGEIRGRLFDSFKLFRDTYIVVVPKLKDKVLESVVSTQERFIETIIGFCTQTRSLKVYRGQYPVFEMIFKNIQIAIIKQREIISHVEKINPENILELYKEILQLFLKQGKIEAKEQESMEQIEELNAMFVQLQESLKVMCRDISIHIKKSDNG